MATPGSRPRSPSPSHVDISWPSSHSGDATAAPVDSGPGDKAAQEGATIVGPAGSIHLAMDAVSPNLEAREGFDPAGVRQDVRAVGGFVSVVVLGASGDLASRKIFPALANLFATGFIPNKNIAFVGYARSKLSHDDFVKRIQGKLKPSDTLTPEKITAFCENLSYVAGTYDTESGFQALAEHLSKLEAGHKSANRMFYLSLPPSVFLDVAKYLSRHVSSRTGFTRAVIEKPFGRDSASSAELSRGLSQHFTERQMYRIDHYLGKEIVQNLLVMRFANTIYEPLWNHHHIESVSISFKEELSVEGRGGYFDQYGIIRDVMQNHLTQILALVAMEPPVSLASDDIRAEKTKVLRSTETLKLENFVVGQYKSSKDGKIPAYVKDATVPKGSTTPTFGACVAYINNHRWQGVPFYMVAGKGLDERLAEIRITFRPVPRSLFAAEGVASSTLPQNQLVIRIQPDEQISMRVMNKIPGMTVKLDNSKLDLRYRGKFADNAIPEAYERLILDVLNGEKSLFIGAEELSAAWDLFTPVLKALETTKPEQYPWGSRGPPAADFLAAKHNVKIATTDEE